VVSDSFVALRPSFSLTDIVMSLHTNFPHHDAIVHRRLMKRWCLLAEARLDYLTELFESGRWRRFHSEVEFLENIQEAKDAVDRWRAMAAGETDSSVLPRGSVIYQAPRASTPRPVPALRSTPVPQSASVEAAPAPVSAAPVSTAPMLIPIETLLRQAPPRKATVTPADLNQQQALDPATIGERYPMLRTAMSR
jgi:uncharacterized repeat protein (TIGR03809 family)